MSLAVTEVRIMFRTTLKKKSSINIIPMIDVIFFLLVFFMLFTTFRSNPYGIDMQLPRAVTATEQTNKNFLVEIDENGNYFYDGNNLPLSEIVAQAENRNSETDSLVVIISADKNTKYENVVSVMDGMRQVGIYKLALAAEKEGN